MPDGRWLIFLERTEALSRSSYSSEDVVEPGACKTDSTLPGKRRTLLRYRNPPEVVLVILDFVIRRVRGE